MAFCDFCTCENCTDGAPDLFHAQAVDGRWICDVCFLYDQCTSDDGPAPRNPNGPCDNSECEHRPRLINPQGPDRVGGNARRRCDDQRAMSAGGVKEHVRRNAASMSGKLPSTQSMRHYDWCCGIHGAARHRKGIKRGTSAARRRVDKELISRELKNED